MLGSESTYCGTSACPPTADPLKGFATITGIFGHALVASLGSTCIAGNSRVTRVTAQRVASVQSDRKLARRQ
jgi:hypothetical protein